MRRFGALLIALTAASACSGPVDRAGTGKTLHDSAGVVIVEHSAAYMDALPAWTIDTTPLQQVRTDSTNAAFANILDAVQRADGGWYVADQQQHDIRSFLANGTFERVIARAGRGPGEVGYVTRMQLLARDSLGLIDGNNRRVTVFAPDGRVARQVLFPRLADGSTARVNFLLSNGRLFGAQRRAFVAVRENKDSVYRAPFAVVTFRFAPAARADTVEPRVIIDTIAVAPDAETYRASNTEGGETSVSEEPLRFGRSTITATDGRRLFVATNESAEVVEYGDRGIVRRIRSERAPRAVTPEDRARLERQVLESVTKGPRTAEQKADLQRTILGWRYATTFPFAYRMFAGTDGCLWTEDPWVLVDDARQYVVYDSTGTALARVLLPPRMNVLRVSTRELLGVWKDEDDVPHVRRWKLVQKIR